ncbi:hypothetical protein ACB098_03G062500 [Castanea mollissima]
MANTNAVFSLLFTLTSFSILLLLLPHCIDAHSLEVCMFDAIYQLGDTISDTGNFIHEDPASPFARLPYGETFFNNATGRCSNGLLMIDFLALAAGVFFLSPYLDQDALVFSGHGQNFAVACSTTLPTEVLAKKNILNSDTRRSLNVQLDWVSTYFNGICHNIDDCAEKLKTALFMVGEIGGNDIAMHFSSVVPGNFPIGCLPISLTLFKTNNSAACVEFHCLKGMNNFSTYHNDQLRRALEDLRKEHPNVVIVYGNYNSAFQWVYRFDAASLQKSCCGVGDDYDYSLIKLCGAPDATF